MIVQDWYLREISPSASDSGASRCRLFQLFFLVMSSTSLNNMLTWPFLDVSVLGLILHSLSYPVSPKSEAYFLELQNLSSGERLEYCLILIFADFYTSQTGNFIMDIGTPKYRKGTVSKDSPLNKHQFHFLDSNLTTQASSACHVNQCFFLLKFCIIA